MWSVSDFMDYELIDCGAGEKLERWGEYLVVRPDPQAIWEKAITHPAWERPHARYIRAQTGGGHWQIYDLPEKWQISYRSLTFNIRPMNFKHMGLFPEQAPNWNFIREALSGSREGSRVLNLFAYTGAATVAAAHSGASVCHVDAARGMVNWAKENAASNDLSDRPIRYLVDDCRKFLERENRRGSRYDAIIMDPPSYGRGPSGEVWKMEEGIFDLLEHAIQVLSDKPVFMIVNFYTTGISPGAMRYILAQTVKRRFGGTIESEELGLLVKATGEHLPCGASARWLSSGKKTQVK